VLGLLSVPAIFASVTIVFYGILPYSEIAELRQPSMAGVLEAAVGTWGKGFVSVGLVVSFLGACSGVDRDRRAADLVLPWT
jgi:arginine:ornithine antiporter/lysine permease